MSSRPRTIADLLSFGDRDSLAITDTRGDGLTYAALRNLVSHTHNVLAKLGLNEHDTVAFSLANGPETAALFLALASYCRVAPLNPNYALPEVAFSLDDLKAGVLITSGVDSAAGQAAGSEWRSADSPGNTGIGYARQLCAEHGLVCRVHRVRVASQVRARLHCCYILPAPLRGQSSCL